MASRIERHAIEAATNDFQVVPGGVFGGQAITAEDVRADLLEQWEVAQIDLGLEWPETDAGQSQSVTDHQSWLRQYVETYNTLAEESRIFQ